MINGTLTQELVKRDKIILTLLYSLIVVFGLIANISIIVAILKRKDLQKRQQYILMNLLICDSFTICVTAPYSIYCINIVPPEITEIASNICKSYIFFSYSLGFISVNSMLFISMDRYVAIVYPFFYERQMTNGKVIVLSLLFWLLPGLSLFIAALSPKWIDFDGQPGGFCGVQWSHINLIYVYFLLGFLFILPTTLIFFTNIRVYMIARKQRHIFPCTSKLNRSSAKKDSTFKRIRRRIRSVALVGSVTSRDKQIVSATLLLIVFYLLSWLPFVVPRILSTFGIHTPLVVLIYTPAFAFSNVAWIPLLILWCRNEIRKNVFDIYKEIGHFMTNC